MVLSGNWVGDCADGESHQASPFPTVAVQLCPPLRALPPFLGFVGFPFVWSCGIWERIPGIGSAY